MKRLQLVIIILLCSLSGCVFHPYDNLIGIKALKTVTKTYDSIFVKVTMQTSDAIPFISYYELSGTSDFSDAFNFMNGPSRLCPFTIPLYWCFIFPRHGHWNCILMAQHGRITNMSVSLLNRIAITLSQPAI